MMPLAIYPVIALGTLGLKQCNTGINARMSSAQYSVRSMSIGTMSVGGGKGKCIPDYNWDEAVYKIAKHVKNDRYRWKNKTIDEIVEQIKLINNTGKKYIAKNKNEIIVSTDKNTILIKNRYEQTNAGTMFPNKNPDGTKRSAKQLKAYIEKFLDKNEIDNSI